MLLPGGGLGTVRGHAQWQDTPHGRCTQGCPPLRGEAPQGARPSGEPSGSAADPDARTAREDEPPTANTVASDYQYVGHEWDTYARTAVGTDSDPDSLSNSDLMPLDGTIATPEPSAALANVERVITCRVAVMPHRIICAQRLGNQRSHRSKTQHHL
ncbi:thimet oligopeptidase [Trypanosoma cruzi]|nr:thimet oligopeptidase [Trypanosoma cruzi]